MTRTFTVRLAEWPGDAEALRRVRHAIARDGDGRAIGCGRLLPGGHIGRMAVLRTWRGEGVGRALLDALVELARSLGHRHLQLNAQTHALRFYEQSGFRAVGEPFEEAGIAHQVMERSL
jgi:predicted GNAT family N-acyltransferase